MSGDRLDCLIVGGGPAGLTAAIYLARFLRRVTVIDKDEGRLAMIPRTRNHAGFPGGIAGCDLLERMREQAREYGAVLVTGEVTDLSGSVDDFTVEADCGRFRARTVLLATGVLNRRPPVTADVHHDAVQRGLIRYCPICDGFEQQGKHVGILGAGDSGHGEALFMRTYTDRITLMTLVQSALTEEERDRLHRAGVTIVDTPAAGFAFGEDGVRVSLADGGSVMVDTMYAALGSQTRNDLGKILGTELSGDQCFVTDEHQRCSVPGVYAAGDAVEGLDQISVANGTGARAATAIHNDLRARDGESSDS